LQQTEIDALKKACLYSFPPNKLGYCGPEYSWQSFQKFLSDPSEENAAQVKNHLKRFDALYPYLELIAGANSSQPFDFEVVEAYWIGNSLLDNVKHVKIQETILSFQKHGLPKSIAEKKAANLPEEMLACHSLHVLYVNFISKKVEPVVQNLGNCLIQWAKVLGETSKGIRVKGEELFLESSELKLKEKEKTVLNPFNILLQENDLVSVHWGNAVEKISQDSLKSLKTCTIKNLEAVNVSGSKVV